MKIEVSIGEVVDKITILQLKEENIKDEKKLKYVKEELQVLQKALVDGGVEIPDELFNKLIVLFKIIIKKLSFKIFSSKSISLFY